jgi:hypothetical protein
MGHKNPFLFREPQYPSGLLPVVDKQVIGQPFLRVVGRD